MSDYNSCGYVGTQRMDDGLKREAVEAVSPQAFSPELVGKRQSSNALRKRPVKGGVETGDLQSCRKASFRVFNHLNLGRQVQRRKRHSLLKQAQDSGSDGLMLT